ncbi:MAG: hypothetical protein V1775_03530 [Bacteroidota bacterium]
MNEDIDPFRYLPSGKPGEEISEENSPSTGNNLSFAANSSNKQVVPVKTKKLRTKRTNHFFKEVSGPGNGAFLLSVHSNLSTMFIVNKEKVENDKENSEPESQLVINNEGH